MIDNSTKKALGINIHPFLLSLCVTAITEQKGKPGTIRINSILKFITIAFILWLKAPNIDNVC